jgi:membrane-bound ClpP family serine protease
MVNPLWPAESRANGLMEVTHKIIECQRGLSLILHTPGGHPEAADSIVTYLRFKFESIEVIIPALAMSAGTMIGLETDRPVMGRQSQLGTIDPQLSLGRGWPVSARAVVEQFERVRNEVIKDAGNAQPWAPIVQSMAPSLVQESHRALRYSEVMVTRWLEKHMFADSDNPQGLAKSVAQHFNDPSRHKNLSRIIDRDEARAHKVARSRIHRDHSS